MCCGRAGRKSYGSSACGTRRGASVAAKQLASYISPMPTHPRDISRRDLIVSAAASGLAAFAAPMINRGRFRLFAQTREYSARAIALMERSLVIDMLSPMTLNFPLQAKWNKDPESFTAADFEKFKKSGINVFHPAVGLGGANAYESATQFFAGWNAFLAGNDERFMRIDSPGDFARVKTSKKVAVVLGLQNAEHFRRP